MQIVVIVTIETDIAKDDCKAIGLSGEKGYQVNQIDTGKSAK